LKRGGRRVGANLEASPGLHGHEAALQVMLQNAQAFAHFGGNVAAFQQAAGALHLALESHHARCRVALAGLREHCPPGRLEKLRRQIHLVLHLIHVVLRQSDFSRGNRARYEHRRRKHRKFDFVRHGLDPLFLFPCSLLNR